MTAKTYQTLTKQFEEFDRLIRPNQATLDAARDAHLDVRDRIANDTYIAAMHVADFLQGSYARKTMVKPPLDEYGEPEKADVDIILVTRIPQSTQPQVVLERVRAWLEKEYGEGTAKIQSRSVKLSLANVEVDLVPTTAPSEELDANLRSYAQKSIQMEDTSNPNDILDPEEIFGTGWNVSSDGQWRTEPLRIPDAHAECWQDTHPLATLEFTVEKNRDCNKKFLAVARALKWWRRRAFEQGGQKHPKSYPVEHMAGDHCSGGISSVAEGVTMTLEGLWAAFSKHYPAASPEDIPHLYPRGLDGSDANVISRLDPQDFNAFCQELQKAAAIARNALECADMREAAGLWQRLLGEEFKLPVLPSGGAKPPGGYVAPAAATSQAVGGRFG